MSSEEFTEGVHLPESSSAAILDSSAAILDFEQALLAVAGHAGSLLSPRRTESSALLAARGRVLSESITSDRDQPPFDRATRDGFAVIAGEFSAGEALQIVGTIPAGAAWTGGALVRGQAIKIMTGAVVPRGADAVAMVEHVVEADGFVRAAPGRSLRSDENVVRRGAEAHEGALVLCAGAVLGAAEIALAATCGRSVVEVYTRPRVAIVSTGDELVELNVTPGDHQIRNSNSYALAALVDAAGGEAVQLPITPDARDAVAESIRSARRCDLIVLSGGVSMGEYDLVEEMLLEAGAEFFFTGVRMQPGKPVVFGRLREDGRFFFALPGNPISAQVTFHCFVDPFLRGMGGAGWSGPRWAQATLVEDVSGKPGLTRLLPCHRSGVEVKLVGWQGSGDLAANARANCYAELRPGVGYKAGDVIRVLLR